LPSRHGAADCLADIIDNARLIETYVAGMDRPDFGNNGMVRDAVERCLERICEAAHRLGPAAAELMPRQPWNEIRGMGNRLRHAYDRIDVGVIWNTVHARLPELMSDARSALAGLEAAGGQPTDPKS
jgi:uncharacterized protein with HEPN domain